MALAVSLNRASSAVIQPVDGVATVVPTAPADFMSVITRSTYDREKDDHRAGFRSDDPGSHQWATVGQASSQVESAVTLWWATTSWLVAVFGAVELPRYACAQAAQLL